MAYADVGVTSSTLVRDEHRYLAAGQLQSAPALGEFQRFGRRFRTEPIPSLPLVFQQTPKLQLLWPWHDEITPQPAAARWRI